ncbi:MAG TPA: hypothetical protein VGC92_12575 [Phenylobacterium sp.]
MNLLFWVSLVLAVVVLALLAVAKIYRGKERENSPRADQLPPLGG